jgi:hypothetical protein
MIATAELDAMPRVGADRYHHDVRGALASMCHTVAQRGPQASVVEGGVGPPQDVRAGTVGPHLLTACRDEAIRVDDATHCSRRELVNPGAVGRLPRRVIADEQHVDAGSPTRERQRAPCRSIADHDDVHRNSGGGHACSSSAIRRNCSTTSGV